MSVKIKKILKLEKYSSEPTLPSIAQLLGTEVQRIRLMRDHEYMRRPYACGQFSCDANEPLPI